jgi:hypothetical protein
MLEERTEATSADDRTYEPPTVKSLGSVHELTAGDQSPSPDDFDDSPI